MKQECTELFLRYREIARMIWNLGFWPNAELREWDARELYLEAMARLFEGMILLSLDKHVSKISTGQARLLILRSAERPTL